MDTISISKLKTNPSKALKSAENMPVIIKNRDKIAAYLVGKDIYEKLVSYIEDFIDSESVKKTDFNKGKDFEDVAKELGI